MTLGLPRSGQLEDETAAWRIPARLEPDRAAKLLQNQLDHVEAQTRPFGLDRRHIVSTEEFLEQPCAGFERHAQAAVFDGETDLALTAAYGDGNVPAVRRVFNGVRQQIGDDLLDQLLIRRDHVRPLETTHGQRMTRDLDVCAQALRDVAAAP